MAVSPLFKKLTNNFAFGELNIDKKVAAVAPKIIQQELHKPQDYMIIRKGKVVGYGRI